MSTTPVSGVTSDQPVNIYEPAQTATKQATPPEPTGDTIALSESAQVNQLNEQGQSAKEISQALGIPISTVNSDLGIIAATAATTATAATSVQSTSTPAAK